MTAPFESGPGEAVAPAGDRLGLEAVTFGCRLNAHESDLALRAAAADGVRDAVVVNTCAVTAEAVRQSRQAIRAARRRRPGAAILVTGCAAEIDPDGFASMPETDLVIRNAMKTRRGAYAAAASAELEVSLAAPEAARSRAYVAVQNGCDHRCTFCVIPFGRGASRSVPVETVTAEVRSQVAAGVNEVVLTGVDLTSWGEDFDVGGGPRRRLGDLVGAVLAAVPELPRLRLSSIDAAEIDATLLTLLGTEPRLMPHLHLSLQAGDDLILKRMKRRHLRADALNLVAAVRRRRPKTAFGADLIAGFPTETEAMFQNTLDLVADAGLAYVHVFPFSPRPGTPAARMPQLDRALVKARAERLRAAADAALVRHLEDRIGTVMRALVETPGRARAEDFTEIAFEGAAPAGALIDIRITGRATRRAEGILVGPPPA